jgi:hypothetical protein
MVDLAGRVVSPFKERVSLRRGNFADVLDFTPYDVVFADLGYNM